MVKLAKFVKNGRTREIAMIKGKDGRLAKSPDEAVENLADIHFQGSRRLVLDEVAKSINNMQTKIGKKPFLEQE